MTQAITSFSGAYRFLSNFWPATIVYEGVKYSTTEHAYQAAKSLDPVIREAISFLPYPSQAKKAGKGIKVRADWEEVKLQVMLDVLRLKFNSSEFLRLRLLATAPQELIEGNTWNDTFWGVCNGKGQNHLGKLLMQVRDELSKAA